jgi:hypothetical protein
MAIKGATITITEACDSVLMNQQDEKIIVSNINDINIIIDTMLRLKDRYYLTVSQDVYLNSHE